MVQGNPPLSEIVALLIARTMSGLNVPHHVVPAYAGTHNPWRS
jgi:hypothetical protein